MLVNAMMGGERGEKARREGETERERESRGKPAVPHQCPFYAIGTSYLMGCGERARYLLLYLSTPYLQLHYQYPVPRQTDTSPTCIPATAPTVSERGVATSPR